MERLLVEQMMLEKAKTHILFGKKLVDIRYSSLKKAVRAGHVFLDAVGNDRDRPIEGNAYARLAR